MLPLSVLVTLLLVTLFAGVYQLDVATPLDRLIRGLPQSLFLVVSVGASLVVFIALVRFVHARERLIRELSELRERLELQRGSLATQNTALLAEARQQSDRLSEKVRELEQFRVAMISVLEDLTESRDRIEEARAFDDAVLGNLADGLIVMEADGTVTRANEAAARIFGVSGVDALIGRANTSITIFDERENEVRPEDRPFQKLFAGDPDPKPVRFRGSLRRDDGSTVSVEIEQSLVKLPEKRLIVVALIRDITEQLRIDRAKSEFVSLASHQLRTPLTAISWYAELLLGAEAVRSNPDVREHLREIYLANRRMVDLVDALLNVSRIEMGSFSVEPKPIDLGSLIADEVGSLSPLITHKHLTVTTDIQPGMPPYPADTKLMGIILQNLLSNAVKYTPMGGTIRLSCARDDRWLTLAVTDTGIGIPPDQLGQIFGKMFRASNARIMEGEGSGLGLYLVKSIVDQVRGEIAVASEIEKGTTFTVKLPSDGMKERTGAKALSRSALPPVPAW